MGSNIIELAKLGHERAAELKASCGAVDVRSMAQLISDLATQLEVQFVRSTNMAVQLANAESKCRELAAELSAVDKIHNEAVFITDDHYEQCPPEVQKMIRSLAVLQIPACDAFLAEVRAQVLEAFGEATINIGEDENDEGITYAGNQAMLFAAKLRQEAAQ